MLAGTSMGRLTTCGKRLLWPVLGKALLEWIEMNWNDWRCVDDVRMSSVPLPCCRRTWGRRK